MGDMADYYDPNEYYDDSPMADCGRDSRTIAMRRTDVATKSAAAKRADAPKRFYLVCRDPRTVSYHEPKNAIETEAAARTRATALAKETGHRFYVMAAIASCEPSTPPVEWSDL